MPSRTRIVLLALAASCGVADELPPAGLAEVCGEAGPFRVLELPAGELLFGVGAIGERVLLTTAAVRPAELTGAPPVPEEHTLWSVGRCGEAPVRIDPAEGSLREIDRWPGVALAWHKDAGEFAAVDLTGETASHVVFTGVGTAGYYWTELGLVSLEEQGDEARRVLLHAYPEDPWADTVTGSVVIESVRSGIEVVGDQLFARTLEDSLIRVALPGGEVTEETSDVEAFDVSPDGRWLIWQSPVGVPESLRPKGGVILRDRESGAETVLGVASLRATFGPFTEFADDLLLVNFESDDIREGVMRVYTLPTLAYVDLPPDRVMFGAVSDGRWLLGTWGEQTFDLFDPNTEDVAPLVTRGLMMWLGDGELELLDVPYQKDPDTHLDEEGPLYRVTFAGAARQVADRATIFTWRLADGRWLTGLDLDEKLIGQLVLLDLDAGDAKLVDERVYAHSMQRTDAFGEDVFVYSVDDEARSGVWIVRPGGD